MGSRHSKRAIPSPKNKSLPSIITIQKVGKFWSARITLFYRVLAIKDGEDYIWVWIETHDEYEKMIKD